MSRARRIARVVAAPLLLGAVLWAAGPARVAGALGAADAGWLVAGLGCALAANVVSALRWRALCAWLGIAVEARWALVAYFRGVAVNVVLPGAVVGGDVLRTGALQRRGHPGVAAALSVVGERLSGLWMLAALAGAAAAWGVGTPAGQELVARVPGLAGLATPPVLAAMLLALLAAWLLAPWLLLVAARRTPSGRLRRAVGPLLDDPAPGRRYGAQLLLSLAVQLLSVAALGCAGAALGATVAPWALAAAALPIFLMATLPVSFGGWGTREAAAVVCLVPLGATAAQAVTMSIVYGLYPLAQALVALVPAARSAGPPAPR